METRFERWTFATYADLAALYGAPSLARFFTRCARGTILRRLHADSAPATVAELVVALAEHRHLEITDVDEEATDGLHLRAERSAARQVQAVLGRLGYRLSAHNNPA